MICIITWFLIQKKIIPKDCFLPNRHGSLIVFILNDTNDFQPHMPPPPSRTLSPTLPTIKLQSLTKGRGGKLTTVNVKSLSKKMVIGHQTHLANVWWGVCSLQGSQLALQPCCHLLVLKEANITPNSACCNETIWTHEKANGKMQQVRQEKFCPVSFSHSSNRIKYV